MPIRLRPMTDADLDRVVELECAIFPFPWHRQFFRVDCRRPGGLAIVAEDEEAVVGYAVAWLEADELHVANIAVAPSGQRKGVGSTLLAALIEHGRRHEARTCYLEVRETNAEARQFYTGRGFIATGVRRGYYPGGEDAVIMERDIGPGS